MSVHTLKVIYPSLLFLFGSRENTPPVLFSSDIKGFRIPVVETILSVLLKKGKSPISPTEKGKTPAARFHSLYMLDSTATAIL